MREKGKKREKEEISAKLIDKNLFNIFSKISS